MEVRLRVQGLGGQASVLSLEATSEADAIRIAAARGARVLAIESSPAKSDSSSTVSGTFPLLLFSQELLALLEAGLNLPEALRTLLAKEQRPLGRHVLGEIVRVLSEGRNFSDTLERFPQYFPEVYVATVRSSERTGGMAQALSRYISYQIQFEAIRKKLVSAMIYPAMLLFVGSGVLLFLVGYVVPKFSVVYESSGRELPWMSAAMLGVGRHIHEHWSLFLAVVAAALAALVYALSQPAVRRRLFEKLLRFPCLADKAAEFRLARVYRALSLLLEAGIPLARALRMVSGLLSAEQQTRMSVVCRKVDEGQPLSAALVSEGLAGAVAESLITVGENSGRLADMLERTAAFHDDEFSRWIDWLSRLVEPLLMTVIGLVIGVVVVLMYIPIFELAGGLQ